MNQPDTSRPNVLLISSDQQIFNAIGTQNPAIRTPSLDRLAREGTEFTRAYTPSPVCTPARASIITGQYPSTHGGWTIGAKMPETCTTVGSVLSGHGYDTTLVGKAHFQPLASAPGYESIECPPTLRDLAFWEAFNEKHTPWYGFGHVETCRNHADESHVGGHYAIWMRDHGLTNWADYFNAPDTPDAPDAEREGAWDLPQAFHYSTWTAERTIANIQRSKDSGKPFFIWSSFHDPHPPYLVPEPWASMYDPAEVPIGRLEPGELDHMPPPHRWTQDASADWSVFEEPGGNACHGYHYHGHDEDALRRRTAIYYGMVSLMDQQIGRVLDALAESGMAENTLVIFTSDHGHYLGQHGLIAKGPFHYEEGIRVPMLVKYPGVVPDGRQSPAIQSLVDLMPTVLDMAGVDAPRGMQGVVQTACWTGQTEKVRNNAIVEMRHQPTRIHLRTYINDRYKLTVYRNHEGWGELFDLVDDPRELHNRFDDPAYKDIKLKLMHQLINADLEREPLWMPRLAPA